MRVKKFLAIALSMSLILAMLSACGQGEEKMSEVVSNEGQNEESGTAPDNDSEKGNDEISAASGSDLPLTEEKVTLRMWQKPNSILANITNGDFNNADFWKELEKRTNVHIEFVIPTEGSEQDQLNLMFTGGELCDIIYEAPGSGFGTVMYTDGFDAAVEDGYFLDLTDMMDEYAPNYMRAIQNAPDYVKKATKTDAGRYVCIYTIQQVPQPPFMGDLLRQDWLNDLNLDVPETFADWETMLTAFKNEKGAIAPLAMIPGEVWNLGYGMDAYGATFYVKDGEVRFGLTDDAENCKEYLTILHDWYEKGLIDPDFAAVTNWISGDEVMVTNSQTGAFVGMYTQPVVSYLPSMDASVSFVATNPPKKDESTVLHYRTDDQYMSTGFAISAECEHPDIALRWLDYLFSEEGALLCNYGIEGTSYNMVDGKPQFTEMITEAERVDDIMNLYVMPAGMPGYYSDWQREFQYAGIDGKVHMDTWGEITPDYVYPGHASLSVEETARFNEIFNDANDYINENVSNFITGAKSLDEFESFVDAIRGMGIDTCKEIRQAAYDRFMAR